MTVTVTLSADVARLVEEKAARSGRTLADYLVLLAEREAHGANGIPTLPPPLSAEEFDRLLDELATGAPLPQLRADFSRADIYADHD
jgi:hypothetical protein